MLVRCMNLSEFQQTRKRIQYFLFLLLLLPLRRYGLFHVLQLSIQRCNVHFQVQGYETCIGVSFGER